MASFEFLSIGMIIAERSLKLRRAQNEIEIPVRIFAPQRDRDSWSCGYEIEWPEGLRAGRAGGFDSVQALLFDLEMVGAEIYTSDYHKSGHLIWTEPQLGYGFPVPHNIRDMLIGDDARYL